MFAAMQLALIYVGNQVVNYASYSAARAAMVADVSDDTSPREAADRAASLVCAPVTGPTVAGSSFAPGELRSADAMIEVPGWGALPGSGISRHLKTHAWDVRTDGDRVSVTVTHYYELIFPVVNHLFAWLAREPAEGVEVTGPTGTASAASEREFESRVGIWDVRAPHMRLRRTTTLARPWSEWEE
jgi:hypothetical protein